jgi:hypothetical protein
VRVPWADPKTGFTHPFEAQAIEVLENACAASKPATFYESAGWDICRAGMSRHTQNGVFWPSLGHGSAPPSPTLAGEDACSTSPAGSRRAIHPQRPRQHVRQPLTAGMPARQMTLPPASSSPAPARPHLTDAPHQAAQDADDGFGHASCGSRTGRPILDPGPVSAIRIQPEWIGQNCKSRLTPKAIYCHFDYVR